FPIGAFALSIGFDALHGLTHDPEHARAARMTLDVGLVTAVAAAPFGFVDWRAIAPGTRAKRIGLIHAVGNAAMLALFATSRARSQRRTPAFSREGPLCNGVPSLRRHGLVGRRARVTARDWCAPGRGPGVRAKRTCAD
ncbi:MAG: DUF2231 domain-containing protein, partial [Polyangiaceae bacterium]